MSLVPVLDGRQTTCHFIINRDLYLWALVPLSRKTLANINIKSCATRRDIYSLEGGRREGTAMFKKFLRLNVFVVQLLSFGPVEEGKYMKLKNKVATVVCSGRFYLLDPTSNTCFGKLINKIVEILEPEHVRMYSTRELMNMFAPAGLKYDGTEALQSIEKIQIAEK